MKVPGTYARPAVRVWDGPIPGTHEPGFVEQPIRERPDLSSSIVYDGEVYTLRTMEMGECRILMGHEPSDGELRWHLTISCPERHPTWDEIKTARYRLLGPDLDAAMFLPPAAEYINLPDHDHVFHVWEVG